MITQLTLGELSVDVRFKDIKNLHLSVHPPTGRITISAPERMKIDAVRLFAISKIEWIKRQQISFLRQERESPRDFVERESHYVWGRRYLLKVLESDRERGLELSHQTMLMYVRPSTDISERKTILSRFYRDQLRAAAALFLEKWQPIVGANVQNFSIRRMKTKWGSCNPKSRTIRLNTELAKKPQYCLEYVVVHEMVHMLEARHGKNFVRLMNELLPEWRHRRDELNWRPLAHETWKE
jgi:predicted metal-dependent hydrolase